MKVLLLGGRSDGKVMEIPRFMTPIQTYDMPVQPARIPQRPSETVEYKVVTYHYSERLSPRDTTLPCVFVSETVERNSDEAALLLMHRAIKGSLKATGVGCCGLALYIEQDAYDEETSYAIRLLREKAGELRQRGPVHLVNPIHKDALGFPEPAKP